MPLSAQALTYPKTERGTVADVQFGEAVKDPYRWLENDVRQDPKVREWVTAENAVTDAYLKTLPGREAIAQRLKALWNYERFGLPRKSGGRYFYTRNTGLQNQAVLYVRDTLNGTPRLLIDPNLWAKDGATALSDWNPSEDGKRIVYSIQDGGTDWRTLKVLDVDTGKVMTDEIKFVKTSNGSWAKDGSGFYYSRFPEPAAGDTFQAVNLNSKLYFHRLGTPQSADRLVYETPAHPKWGHYGSVTDDGRWLVIYTSEGTDSRNDITLLDLTKPGATPQPLFTGLKNNWMVAGNEGSDFWFVTDLEAPRLRVVKVAVAGAAPVVTPVIAEDKATLQGAGIVGGKLVAEYLVDAKSEVRVSGLDGKPVRTVALPGIGSVAGFGGKQDDSETFFAFTSFNTPSAIYRYDIASGKATPWAMPKVAFDPANYVVEQRFYPSKDGTKIPLFVVHKKGLNLDKGAPTMLYAYGGFNISMTPSFSPANLAWMDMGGVYAQASLRGGGEYGNAWHDAGRLQNKQNVFDDFIAAGEYLIAQGITTKGKLAIRGGSNGGLLVGAVVNQRPDLFAAALPAVGVMDMLRFDRFTAGRYWTDDYGYPSKEADFRVLRAYSPYHNIADGKPYPAVLVTTADTDDRVVPGHSFKYTATLQAAKVGDKPHLIRIETRAGHGSGKPTDKIIEEYTDLWAFAGKWTGLTTAAEGAIAGGQ
ncbi:prolyl oligopeptidase family serine peptidase [Sphingomonas prati]|uniref:prolyl oligopeptidase n=1 Tax=Sphingomonas prati TaxID=1843237 RepID=A0A7W9BTL6_9SPHN|nr:prolyl oligopeptidase family serine peptidase [Sphingomonas prati]MBB5729898.1 prolyl oligopeptidase [Sphingomonas prati]GGE88690.1 prolyl endopeptidase [Sphingomonas prati]